MKNEHMATDENKINSQYQKLVNDSRKSGSAPISPINDNPNIKPAGSTVTGPMGGGMMTWTQMIESLNNVLDSIDSQSNDPGNDIVPTDTPADDNVGGDDELIKQLNKIFTPVLIMQGFENDAADKINEQMSESSMEFVEKSVIQFDNDTRMAQLIAACAKLIARQKNSEKYQTYAKAYNVKKKMELEIQKDEYDAAKALAQKYLVNVSTTNNSPVARDAATALLPATQH